MVKLASDDSGTGPRSQMAFPRFGFPAREGRLQYAPAGPSPGMASGNPMDVIFIRDLRIATLIGVFDWERRIRQTVVLDLEMATDCRRAAEQDDLADALDYKAVSKRIIGFVEESRFELVETLAERVAGIVVEEFGVPWVRLRVNKEGALRGAKDVGVVIERGERGP